ncbi:hypothetical protein A3J41_00075 [candidate division TM6 bacterium RIFCSPHIGHO2_12_FULL_38_8]|nr:MAG: hypothetical protein A3J41_00075 [candidate division TM6 bacterium RIFCSPHIGHO2_12_FULL_38_8]
MKKYGILLCSLLLAHQTCPSDSAGINTNINPTPTDKENIDGKISILLSALTLLLATKIGYDMSWHTTYACKADNWYALLNNTVQKNQITCVTNEHLKSLFCPVDHDEIMQLHDWLNNSYNSWLKPWNWTESQQKSFNQLHAVEILTMYADLLPLQDTVTGKDLVKAFRNKYVALSIYPLVFAYEMIEKHLQFIAARKDLNLYALLQQIMPYLNNFKLLLRQEPDYALELQAKRTNDLQKETVLAIQSLNNRR